MRAYVDIYNISPRSYTLHQLEENRIDVVVYEVMGKNEIVGLMDMRGNGVSGIRELIIPEQVPEPLWKQQMRIQMGQRPRQINRDRIYRLREIDNEAAISRRKIKVYTVRL